MLCALFVSMAVCAEDSIPADTIPADTIPEIIIPSDTIPTDTIPSVPTDTIPSDTIPEIIIPSDTIPTDTIPSVPTDTIPSDTLPVVRIDTFLLLCREIGLPILHIETVDSVMPTCEVIEAPQGCDGRSITTNEKVGAHLWIELAGDTIYDSGGYENKKSGLTIKVRGNTSATASGYYGEKKPYKLKLQKSADLLFRGADSIYADKEWVLLRYMICETMAGNMTNRLLGMPWTPAEQVVFLFLNGDFRGMYLLSECVKRNSDCRVDIKKTGFLYEYDAYWWNSAYYLPSTDVNYRYNYTLKYPDEDDILPWQEDYLTESIRQVEEAYCTKGAIDDVIDVRSYARWLWVHDMLGDRDAGGSNLFLSKYDTLSTSKTAMSCAWDFGACFSSKRYEKWSAQHQFWCFSYFFSLPQHSFVKEYIDMFDNVVDYAFDTLVHQLGQLRASDLTTQMNAGKKLDNKRWKISEMMPMQRLGIMMSYLIKRQSDIRNLMANLRNEYQRPITTSLPDVQRQDASVMCYDILGRPLTKPAKGSLMIVRQPDGSITKTYCE